MVAHSGGLISLLIAGLVRQGRYCAPGMFIGCQTLDMFGIILGVRFCSTFRLFYPRAIECG